jgi:four helix bundle protein
MLWRRGSMEASVAYALARVDPLLARPHLMSDQVEDFEDLRVYRAAFRHAMTIFDVSGEWPKEERYALTDQIRRSSRAVCSNIAEAWSKRRYEAHFVSKLSDAERESRRDDYVARLCERLSVPV